MSPSCTSGVSAVGRLLRCLRTTKHTIMVDSNRKTTTAKQSTKISTGSSEKFEFEEAVFPKMK